MKTTEETRDEMLEAMGWSIVCQNPFEMEHKDGSSVKGKTMCEIIIESAIKDYKKMKIEEVKEAERQEKLKTTKELDLNTINGNEIIDFLNNATSDTHNDWSHIYITPVKFESQEIKNGEYILYFTATFNNWGTDQEMDDNQIYIGPKGISVHVDEPWEGDGTEEVMEEMMTEWLKTHEFKQNQEEEFIGLLKESYDSLGEVGFENKKELQNVIDKLVKAQTYMR